MHTLPNVINRGTKFKILYPIDYPVDTTNKGINRYRTLNILYLKIKATY